MLLVDKSAPDLIVRVEQLRARDADMDSQRELPRTLTQQALETIPLQPLEELLEDVVLNWLELVRDPDMLASILRWGEGRYASSVTD